MKRTIRFTALAACALGLAFSTTACKFRTAKFAVISTKTPQWANIADAAVKRNVPGKDSRLWFTILPLGGRTTLQEAVDDALRTATGDFMTDVTVYRKVWTCFLFSGDSLIVEGSVGNSKRGERLVDPVEPRYVPQTSRRKKVDTPPVEIEPEEAVDAPPAQIEPAETVEENSPGTDATE